MELINTSTELKYIAKNTDQFSIFFSYLSILYKVMNSSTLNECLLLVFWPWGQTWHWSLLARPLKSINIGSPMVCDVIWFLSNSCVFYPLSGIENHITLQDIGRFFLSHIYHPRPVFVLYSSKGVALEYTMWYQKIITWVISLWYQR
jgi:hypothetical protein